MIVFEYGEYKIEFDEHQNTLKNELIKLVKTL